MTTEINQLRGNETSKERIEVAKSSSTNLHTLEIIATYDQDPNVAVSVLKNPNLTEKIANIIKDRFGNYDETILCPIAWNHIATFSNGDVRACCEMIGESANYGRHFDKDGVALNTHVNTFEEIRNSEFAKKIRRQMMNGDKPSECHQCYDREIHGMNSKRTSALSRYRRNLLNDLKYTEQDGTIDTNFVHIRDLDLRFGNACNLKCRTCGPNDSNLWYEDFYKLAVDRDPTINEVPLTFHGSVHKYKITKVNNKYDVNTTDFSWDDSTPFYEDILSNLENIETLYFTGGEPTINKRHRLLLERCIDTGHAKNISLDYNTNFHSMSTYLVKYWKKFKQVNLSISIDGYGSTQEYLRPPSKWNIIESNVKMVANEVLGHNIRLSFSPTISILNIMNITKLIEWILDLDHPNINPIMSNHTLYYPEFYSLQHIPVAVKHKIQEHFDKWFEYAQLTYDSEIYKQYKHNMDSVLTYMWNSNNRDLTTDLLSVTRKVDKIRGECLEQSMPEFFAVYKDAGCIKK